ncbi:K(+)/H(+) antiporter NhaP2 [Pirellulimonas nuda]|uniref:K(+)/H(+) antiporter NhaP2 n=2 Tax=Pirellulimonas nuda TaxID=2528009 RepID=A0A518DJI5_9BACT|nr:K(+)/H(+) antiporter NhaP2 [Pirellulimonas nuda]
MNDYVTISIYLAAVLALGIAAQWIAWWRKLPAILLLLVFGLLLGWQAGPPRLWVGDKAIPPMTSLAVGVVLFEGGLSLRWREIRETSSVVVRLVSVGLLITWVGAALAAHYLAGFSWGLATLTGALLTVSGPTVIMPLLRQVRPERKIGSVIKWEGIVNDPIGAVLAALVFEVVAHGGGGLATEWFNGLAWSLCVGAVLGAVTALVIVELLARFWVPDYLQNGVILSLVMLVFAVSNYLQHESGLITVTVIGVWLANQRRASVKHVIEFKENLRVLLISVLFIILSSRVQITMADINRLGWGGLLFPVVLILLVRPLAVFVSTIGAPLNWREKTMLAWVHPRGIVAAAVASLFAIELSQQSRGAEAGELAAGLTGEGQQLVVLVFLTIVLTVTVYGLTLGPLARRLGLSRQNPQGVLFAGASPMIRELATAIQKEGFHTVLVDTNPQNVAAARLAGIPVVYAAIGSEFIHDEIDLGDVGRLLAMTPNDEVNAIAAMEFAPELGGANVYQIAPSQRSQERLQRIPAHRRGRVLFRDGLTYDDLQNRFAQGAQIKKTSLSKDFTYAAFRAKYGEAAVVLFAVPEKGRLIVNTAKTPLEPKAGYKLIALIDPSAVVAGDSAILTPASDAPA